MLALKHRFMATDTRQRIEADRRRTREINRRREEREKKDEAEQDTNDAVTAFATAVTVSTPATPERVLEFEATLTEYDMAVVEALMRNDDLMAKLDAAIFVMLEQAHVLEDGRRVFRTKDGTQVFDEFGEEVSADVIHPDAIDPAAPTWEAFSAKLDERNELVQQREGILAYQNRLDEARSEIEDGEISLEELEVLEAELADSMPPAVAAHVEGLEPATPTPGVVQDQRPTMPVRDSAGQTSGLDTMTPG